MTDTVETSPDITVDTTADHTADTTVDTIAVKKAARLEQLALARQSGKDKKRKTQESITNMEAKLEKLSTLLEKPKEQEKQEEPDKKRIRVTRQDESDDDVTSEGWTTSAIRGTVLVGLAGASWYMQNMFRKPTAKTASAVVTKKTNATPDAVQIKQPTVLSKNENKFKVGGSGFMM
jgi:hypothetical protein